jgi:hypothetical protein
LPGDIQDASTQWLLPAKVSLQTRHLQLRVFTANIWLNGQQIATSEQIAGTFRIHELNIKSVARAGALNTPR